MIGRTGIYRVRRTLFGKCILQFQSRSLRADSEGGGYEFTWTDEDYSNAPAQLEKVEYLKGKV